MGGHQQTILAECSVISLNAILCGPGVRTAGGNFEKEIGFAIRFWAETPAEILRPSTLRVCLKLLTV